MPEPPLDPLQPVLQRQCLDGIVVRQAFDVLLEAGQPHGDVEPVEDRYGAGREFTRQCAYAVAASIVIGWVTGRP